MLNMLSSRYNMLPSAEAIKNRKFYDSPGLARSQAAYYS
jgi:hypothetical protein